MLLACPEPLPPQTWKTVAIGLNEAALSVSTSGSNVWIAGADRGRGPLVLRSTGGDFERVATKVEGDLWWVQSFADGTALMGGSAGLLLRFDGSAFVRLKTPSLGAQTIFGIWGVSSHDAFLVGGSAGRNGFIWRLNADDVTVVALPANMPLRSDGDLPALLKVWADENGTAWIVGDRGTVLRKLKNDPDFSVVPMPSKERFFTVHGSNDSVTVVGGSTQGSIFDFTNGVATDVSPAGAPIFQGVFRTTKDNAWAVGAGGKIFERKNNAWQLAEGVPTIEVESLHAVAVDSAQRVWAVGGNVLSPALNQGVVLVRSGAAVNTYEQPLPPPTPALMCPVSQIDPQPNKSIARRWNEQLLAAIRADTPRPGVHARNLFHVSAAMYDAWAAFDPVADGVFFREKIPLPSDVEAQREAAISFAALRVLEHRYGAATGGAVSATCFRALMAKLNLDATNVSVEGNSGIAVGNRVAALIIEAHKQDGSYEFDRYADPTYIPANKPLIVDVPGVAPEQPGKWQPLNLSKAVTQNGIVLPGGIQSFIGSQWGTVKSFALGEIMPSGLYFDAGVVPAFDEAIKPQLVDVIRRSDSLDPADATEINLSPSSLGNNPLGTNGGTGFSKNPVTGLPYAPNRAKVSDFGRVLAEFWADGPSSETPPGHWNVLANGVCDTPGFKRQFKGAGPFLSALEWDVKMYLAINGAVHDAAIVAWGLKRRYETARPISLIRHMANLGQSSQPTGTRYHPMGLPLVPGLIELVTAESAAPGQRHQHLKEYAGSIALRSWRGEPGNRKDDVGGTAWIRGIEWVPYQRRTFVTPAFPGFISGHSTFSRSAAEVLTEITGSAYFPGGLGSFTAPIGYLSFERGPSAPVTLQWATYYDAADQAGQSRLWGGIHIAPDDLMGRVLGAEIGKRAFKRATAFFDGTAVP
jgi:hypothetical protein